MAAGYLYSTISSLPAGYDCTVPLPSARIAERLAGGSGEVEFCHRVLFDGDCVFEQTKRAVFRNGKAENPDEPFVWRDAGGQWDGGTGYLDLSVEAVDREPIFSSKAILDFYAIYSKPGKKSFFSDNAYKFGAPPIISQIAKFGRYVDAHPLIHLDRERDLGETITIINPYNKPVLVEIVAHDGRRLPRTRVAPRSAHNVRLADLLEPGEASWLGHIQLTANNRVVTYNVKHSLADPTIISDHEHLDPFRAEPTHMPATQMARFRFGQFMKSRGWAALQ